MTLTRPSINVPSFAQGFAQNATQSANAHLWKGINVVYAPFLGKQGTSLLDWSGKRKHGTLINMTADDWVPTPFGIALDFDGAGGCVGTPDSTIGPTVFTALVLVMAPVPDANNKMIMSQWDPGNSQKSWAITAGAVEAGGGRGAIRIFLSSNGSAGVGWDADNIILDGKAHLVGFTFNGNKSSGSRIKIYYDGAEASGSGTDLTSLHNSTTPADIGCRKSGGSRNSFFQGKIGFAANWNRCLTPSEMKQFAINPWALFEPIKTFVPPIWFVTGAIYQGNGTAISPVVSMGGDQVNWDNFLNTITETSGQLTDTSTTVEVRTTDDGVTWSGYSDISTAANSIFGQIRLTLNADSEQVHSPIVKIIKLRALMKSAVMPFHFEGIKSIEIDDGDSPYTAPLVPEKEVLIECDTDSGVITVNLNAALDMAGKVINIKNTGTSSNKITVDASGAETIDGQITQDVEDFENLRIQSNGITWNIL